ncbi:7559_t:CDS:1, partial [Cetraspora pellucida]
AITKMQQTITNKINIAIKPLIFNLTTTLINQDSNNEDINISNTKIIKLITKLIEKDAYKLIKKILAYLISVWLKKGIIKIDLSTINIRILDNSHNIDKKVKHVMFIFAILNYLKNIFKPDNHHTPILYLSIENYKSLEVVLNTLIADLNSIKDSYKDQQDRQ